MAIEIGRIANANVYLNGASLLGKTEEIDLPDVKALMKEHKALGLVGKFDLPCGIDKLEGKIKWTSFYPDVLGAAANPFKMHQLMVRGSVETYTGQGRTDETALVVMMTAGFKKLPLGKFKQHEPAEVESEFHAHYVKMTLGGKDIIEIDVLANIFKTDADGDLLATFRNILGV
jgi:P2 family phage contractile tail tube protein